MQTAPTQTTYSRIAVATQRPTRPGDWSTWLALVLFWLAIFLSPLLYDLAQRATGL